jgi:hypothetical protein
LADGATESSFAALWAQLLVNDFVQNAACDIDNWKASLSALQEQWYASVRRPSLSWNVEAKLEQGAFATFLGVTMVRSPDGIPHWAAMAVGDTCLFHTRGSTLLRAFPLEQSNKFNNSPPLLGSRMSPEAIQKTPALHLHGDGLADDRLWMMTDALVQWCLMEHEGGRDPWGEIDSILAQPEPQRRFAAWIDELRFSRQLHNDDVTLLLIIL